MVTFIQYDDYAPTYSETSTTISNDTALNTTTGNFLVVVINSAKLVDYAGIVTGITDTAGNTYQKAIGVYRAGNQYIRTEIWYAENITGNANNITTATYTATSTGRYISVAEFSGIATSSSLLDTSSNPQGPVTSHTSNTATSTSTGDLIIGGFCSTQTENITLGTGFTTLSSDLTAVYDLAEYDILDVAGDYAATATTGTTTYTIMACAIFAIGEEPPAGTNAKINIGDAWKNVDVIKINIGDAWKNVNSAKINIGDAWKTIF